MRRPKYLCLISAPSRYELDTRSRVLGGASRAHCSLFSSSQRFVALYNLNPPLEAIYEEGEGNVSLKCVPFIPPPTHLETQLNTAHRNLFATSTHKCYVRVLKSGVRSVPAGLKSSSSATLRVKERPRTGGCLSSVSLQRLIQYELIFRLLLKVTVDWPR